MTRHQWCNISAAAFALCVVGPICFFLFDRDPPFERVTGYILPNKAAPGETATIVWDGQIKRLCEGVVTRQLIDANGTVFAYTPVPAVYASRGSGPGPFRLQREFKLPTGSAPGPAKYCSESRFACNWFQQWWPIHTSACTDFEISPATK